jgi:phospholipase/carboxylesterase
MIPGVAFLLVWTALLSGCSSTPPPERTAVATEAADAVWDEAVVFLVGDPPEGTPVCTVVGLHGYNTRPPQLKGLFTGIEHPLQVVIPQGPKVASRVGWAWFDRKAHVEPEVLAAQVVEQADRLVNGLARLDQGPVLRPVAGKPVVTGFSQGGMLSFAVAVHHPDAVRASLPLSGFLPTDAIPEGRASSESAPIQAFHGVLDTVLPLDDARTTVDHLQARGWPVDLKVYDGVSHSVPPAVRADWRRALAEACSP